MATLIVVVVLIITVQEPLVLVLAYMNQTKNEEQYEY